MSLEALFEELATVQLNYVEDTSLDQSLGFNLEESPTYNWNGATMSADVGIPIPVVYGRHLVAPNLVNVFIEEGENETINMLLAVGEGEIEGISNIKLDDVPIENFYGEAVNDPYGENAEVTVRTGALNQDAVQNFDDTHLVTPVVQTLQKGVPYIFTTVGSSVEAFKVEFNIQRLFQKDDGGNQLSWYVAVQIEYKLTTDVNWTQAGIHNYNKNTTSSFKRYFKSEYLTAGQYDVRVTRVSDNSDANHIGELVLNSVDEITTTKLSYPGTALLGIRLVAGEKLNQSRPNVTCLVTGTKVRVPDVRNSLNEEVEWEDYYWDESTGAFRLLANDSALVWDGATYRTSWSANPVWCLRDMLLSTRYGLGDFVIESQLDDASFLASAKYCDEGVANLDGNKEKRLRTDIVIDTQTGALDCLYQLCSTFRGLLYISSSSGRIRLVIERDAAPEYMFTMGNIVRNSLSITYLTDANIPNVVKVDYTNKDKNFQRDTIEDGLESEISEGVEIVEEYVQLIGCTRTSQALREGRIRLNKARLNRTRIAFSAGKEARLLQANDVIEFQHDLPAWGEGGRVRAGSTTTLVKLDKTVDLDVGEVYEIGVKNGITDQIEVRTVTTPSGQTNEIQVSVPFSFQPAEFDVWNFGIQGYRTKQYRIVSMDKSDRVAIQAVEYNADVYDYTGIQTPQDNFTYLTLEIPNVSDLTAEERVVRLESGAIDQSINVSFTKPPTGARWLKKVVRFQFYLSDDNGVSWNYVGDTDKEFYTIKVPLTVGTRYLVSVVSVTENGEQKVPANSPKVALLIEGWSNAPVNVSGLSYTFDDEITLSWDKSPDADIDSYEIRTIDDNWGVDNAQLIWRGRAEKYTIVRPSARQGITYFVKAINTSGIYSDVASYVTPVNPPPSALALTFLNVFQKAYLMWQDSTDPDLVEYEIWVNDSAAFTGIEGATERMVTKAQGTSATLILEYSTTYFRVRGVDSYGPGEWSNVVTVPSVDIVSSDIANNAIQSQHLGAGSVIAEKISAGSIQAGHISALAVTAEKINVACLSAISANMGTITAGMMIGACIKTSNQIYRMEINNSGLFGYNQDGVNTVKLEQGQLCLINPVNTQFYSYLDAGSLKFHHPYGEVPYLKRLCSGEALTGATVTLCQWYEQPQVTVSAKKLTTYDSANSVDSQEICVYADNIRFWDAGGANFGWRFDVHAELKLSGGVRDECIYNSSFDVTQTTLGATCSALVKQTWTLFCHDVSPNPYYYGCSCYEVRYRLQGSGVWCSCAYEYIQPHSTKTELEGLYTTCQTVGFGASGCWEVQMHQNGLSWVNSSIQSGAYCCCLCQCYYPVDCSYYATFSDTKTITEGFGAGVSVPNPYQYCQCIETNYVALGSWNETLYPVCYSCVSYNSCMFLNIFSCSGSSSISVTGDYGGSQSMSAGANVHCYGTRILYGGNYCGGLICQVGFTITATVNAGGVVGVNPDYSNATHCYGGTTICRTICYKQCCICCCLCEFWYYTWVGASACCDYKKFYSMQEIKGTQCVLDPNGVLNYLAVAYA